MTLWSYTGAGSSNPRNSKTSYCKGRVSATYYDGHLIIDGNVTHRRYMYNGRRRDDARQLTDAHRQMVHHGGDVQSRARERLAVHGDEAPAHLLSAGRCGRPAAAAARRRGRQRTPP